MDYIDKKRFPHGIITAVVTPFKNGQVDYSSFKHLLNRQIKAGIDGVVILGTTGEVSTVTQAERSRIIDFAVSCIDKRTFVIVGCGGSDTASASSAARAACAQGADGILTVAPYYNKPSQDGIIRHYLTVAEQTDLPLMMYNVPSRTGVNISADTAQVLLAHENISALKEASTDIADVTEKLSALTGCDVFCGNDHLLLPFLALGCVGCVSVVSNALPQSFRLIYDKFLLNKPYEARETFTRLYPLLHALCLETNPVGIKALLSYFELCESDVRLPLTKCTKKTLNEIIKAYSDTDCVI